MLVRSSRASVLSASWLWRVGSVVVLVGVLWLCVSWAVGVA